MKVERFAILAAFIFASTTALANGVVSSVVKAPITPDGDVAGAPTDLVIDLDTWLDPATNGRPLLAGCSVAVTLPDAFEWTGLPVRDAPATSPQSCLRPMHLAVPAAVSSWPSSTRRPASSSG